MNCTGFAFILVLITCEPPAPPVPPPVLDAARFCQVARPLLWAPADTAETRRQIKRHNAAWAAACRGGKQK